MKILMIIAKENFRDEEFQMPYDLFRQNGFEVHIASTSTGDCIGMFNTIVKSNYTIHDVDITPYNAIVLVGGGGAKTLVSNPELETLLNLAQSKDKIIAAICYAPVILAKAGLLKEKNATVWNENTLQRPILESCGANFIEKDVVTDEKIITANGPKAAHKFADEIIKVIQH